MLEKLSFKVCFSYGHLRGLYITLWRLAVVFWITNKREGESEKIEGNNFYTGGSKDGKAFLIQ